MFSKILVAVGGAEDATETVPVVTGLAKAFDSKVLVVHMRERVVTAANFLIDSESRLKGAFADMGKPAASGMNTAPNKPPAPAQNLSIEILEPKAAKTGSNPVRVMVRDNAGKPVTGAEVQISLFMPQMGSMPPMTARAALKDAGNGIYIGQIDIPMAWTWQTTITVSRAGATLGATQTTITAR